MAARRCVGLLYETINFFSSESNLVGIFTESSSSKYLIRIWPGEKKGHQSAWAKETLKNFRIQNKDKEALFKVAYNKTDNISSQAILPHNNITCRNLSV